MTTEIRKKIENLKGEYDILCVGELLTDYISKEDKPLKEVELFEKFLGGSPANIVVHFHNLGLKPALFTKIGKDSDGQFLMDALKKFELQAAHIRVSSDKVTTRSMLARRSVKGETPEFEIIRGADTNLKKEEIDIELVKKAKIVHTNTFSLAEEPTRSTILYALEAAKEHDKFISFDPNYRSEVWPDKKEALEILKKVYTMVDITKPSMDDAYALFGKMKPEEYIAKYHSLGAKIVVLTMGSKGSIISNGEKLVEIPVEQCEAVDATGAGDLYWSAFLKGILEGKRLKACGRMASYAATKAVMTSGAILEKEEYEQMNSYMKMFS